MPTAPLAKRLKRLLRYGALRVGLALLRLFPIRWTSAWGGRFGALAFHLAGGERRKALDSLSRAFPEWSEDQRRRTAQACFVHLGRCAFELTGVDREDLDRWVELPAEDEAVLRAAHARGQGVVFVTGHVGNWELLARRVVRLGLPAQTIAKENVDPRLTRLVDEWRSRGNVRSIWRGQEGAARQMLRALRAGELLGLLIDQDTRVQSVFVPFFGHLASTPRAAADLVLRTGAAAVMAFCQRQPDGWHYRVRMRELAVDRALEREAGTLKLTAQMTAEIESAIRSAPEQWVWMHRRWKTQP